MRLDETPINFQKDLHNAVGYLNSIGIEEIYLFGSIARNEANDKSDIDIAVRGIKPEDFFQVYGELLMKVNHPFDLVDLNLQEEFGDRLIKDKQLERLYL
ncbi:nucleotidyltransferase domain-containing protein [Thiospirochaeta perfilievii]|uniref:Nucleotidyltransferase domain-containing protein n=1 Tax=Thiospirochaeta perfilievii TaxID=252967 RepID=A0A5C1Q8L0_9SPIO|nr:nucleotidyltransferase domain-containing protein [Thiospirochaeta perfilievii]QEN03380.1 nucleotidyltransferase domain-containing protein [Thiospirochaeta perfilievii]